MINLFEYQNKEEFPKEHFENLEVFLDDIWNKREKTSYYTEDENQVEVQRFLQFFHKKNELKSNKFVGVIHFQEHTINLLPKLFYTNQPTTDEDVKVVNAHVLWWLSYCRKLKFPNYLSGLSNEKADFFEILIYLFSKYTKELLNSTIYQKYVEVESELNFVKGRINFNSYINENLAKGWNHKVNCTFDSFEMDNEFNQCVKQVAKLLFSVAKDYQNKRNLSDILFLLDEVSDVAISVEQCKRMQFNPMFSCFETVRDYCVLFLENSVSFHYKNSLKLFAFLLPMEYVFEDFIFGFINKEIDGVNPKGQVSGTYLDEAKTFGLKPDLILDLGIKKVIADTKYKLVYTNESDSKKGISQTDLYQMIAYAIRFDITEIKLFYPNTITSKDTKHISQVVVKDELAGKLPITITTHQLSVLDKSINSLSLSEFDNFIEGFEGLRFRLKGELEEVLGLGRLRNPFISH